ncbi:hypothetical protein BC828DRAFT_275598 [Blastocladiella britannica]|nr:hypothetical protein BC828DRAFT_275598 [Blastocladiella britannica]
MLEGYSFIISGRVQGVYFRKYTCDQGNALGLVGNVRNNPDGTVSGVIASMDPARLQDIILASSLDAFIDLIVSAIFLARGFCLERLCTGRCRRCCCCRRRSRRNRRCWRNLASQGALAQARQPVRSFCQLRHDSSVRGCLCAEDGAGNPLARQPRKHQLLVRGAQRLEQQHVCVHVAVDQVASEPAPNGRQRRERCRLVQALLGQVHRFDQVKVEPRRTNRHQQLIGCIKKTIKMFERHKSTCEKKKYVQEA